MTLRETLSRLLEAAQQFQIKTPKYQRIESERQALRDAITDAQLVLSVQEQTKQTQACPILAVGPQAPFLAKWRHCLVVLL